MKQSDSDWVTHMFAENARVWTPINAQSIVQVLFAPISTHLDASRRCLSVLSAKEFDKADRFKLDDDKNQFIQRRAFRRYCASLALASNSPLSQLAFHETEKGRPYLPDNLGWWFSFSACRGGLLGAWSTTHAVGVDLEITKQKLEPAELAQQYFSANETKMISDLQGTDQTTQFLQLWSLKEAALKSIGEGLPFGLDAFQFELKPTLRVIQTPQGAGKTAQFSAYLFKEKGLCGSLIIRSKNKGAG